MSRRHFSIFNFTFLDWMVGFLGCVIIQLLMAQKSIEQLPCPSIRQQMRAIVDSVSGVVYAYPSESQMAGLKMQDSILLIVQGFKELPRDTIVVARGHSGTTAGDEPHQLPIIPPPVAIAPPMNDNYLKQISQQLNGRINFLIQYEDSREDFRLQVECGKDRIRYGTGSRFFSANRIVFSTIKYKREGTFRNDYYGEKLTMLEKAVPGIYKIYLQYRGNKKDPAKETGSVDLLTVSKNRYETSKQFNFTLTKTRNPREFTPVLTVEIKSDGTLIYHQNQ